MYSDDWYQDSIKEQEDYLSRFWNKVIKSEEPDGCWIWKWNTSNFFRAGQTFNYTYQGKTMPVYRISWILTHGKIEKGLVVCHKCDNRICVRPDHLFLGTQAENMEDMRIKGRTTRGEKNENAKLTEQKVKEIRLLNDRGMTIREIADKFNVTEECIKSVIARKSWKHVV